MKKGPTLKLSSPPVIGEIFGRNNGLRCLVFASPTGSMLASSGSPLLIRVYSTDSSKMTGDFPCSLETQPVVSQTQPVHLQINASSPR